jgi:hypothetical protein
MTIRRRGKKGPFCLYIPKGENRELDWAERCAVIAEFMRWLDGLMPSEAMRRDCTLGRGHELEIHHYRARTKYGRTRPESR